MTQTIRQSFGFKVRALREKTGLAQENFAYQYNIARTYMGNIERGLANPSLNIIQTLAEALDVPAVAFFVNSSDYPAHIQNNNGQKLSQVFGFRVRALRESKGISQEKFAYQCGVARTYISKLDRGLANPSLDAIETLAQALEVSVAQLFEGL